MAANADRQQQYAWKTEAAQPEDEATIACCRLWHSVLYEAVLDFKAGRGSAKFYLRSRSFETLAKLLDLDATAIRERLGIAITYSPQDTATPAPEVRIRKRLGRPPRCPDAPPKPKYVPKERDLTPDLELTTVGERI